MKKIICWVLSISVVLGMFPQVIVAKISQKELKEGEYEIVVIQKGDTLWDLAGKYIGKCYQWPEFEKHNQFTDPHWIYPGERLAIGIKDGKPFIKKAEDFEGELKAELERKNLEIARLKEELERLKQAPPKEVIVSDEAYRLKQEEEKRRFEEDMGILKADADRLRKGMDELARKLSRTEGLLDREKDTLSYEKQEKEKIQKELKQTQEEKEVIAKEEKTQRRYKEILAISAFVGIIIFNSLR